MTQGGKTEGLNIKDEVEEQHRNKYSEFKKL